MNRKMSLPTDVEPKSVTLLKEEYKFVKKLGSGGFATVFLVSNQLDGRFYAAKYQKVRDNEDKGRNQKSDGGGRIVIKFGWMSRSILSNKRLPNV